MQHDLGVRAANSATAPSVPQMMQKPIFSDE